MPKARARASALARARAARSRRRSGEGEDEERLGGLLEGALGEVGGAEVGDRDHGRGEQPPRRAEVAQSGQRRQRR